MSAGHGPVLPVAIWPNHVISTSPALLGFFFSLFAVFTALIVRDEKPGAPRGCYSVVIGYAIGATIVNSIFSRFYHEGGSVLSAYATGLFAGAGIVTYLLCPIWPMFSAPHEPSVPVEGRILIALPAAGIPLVYFTDYRIIGSFMTAGSLLGFWISLFLVNLGLHSSTSLSPRFAAATSVFLVLPEHLMLNLIHEIGGRTT